jgi:hypothetical protein
VGNGGAQQGVDLMQAPPFEGEWELRLEDAGVLTDGCDAINWASMIATSIAEGNARTSALALNAVVFSEPEWGFDIVGVGVGNYAGRQGPNGAYAGGVTVAW